MTSGGPGRRLMMGDPQWRQNSRWTPGEDSKSPKLSLPATTLNSEAGICAAARKADPLALRQREQWQMLMGPISPAISYRTVPQRQLP
jgi:hypothetical protein